MQTCSGFSKSNDSNEAVREASGQWPSGFKPDLILVFHSTAQDASRVAAEFHRLYPTSLLVGCTTAGEHLNGKHFNGALVATAIKSDKVRWSAELIDDLGSFNEGRAQQTADRIIRAFGRKREEISPERYFALCLIDGLSLKEENLSAWMAEALEGIPLLGGSAGDDLKFQKTEVIFNGKAYSNAAVILAAETTFKVEIVKHQHFVKTPVQLVITKCDPATRCVQEIDGLPAIETYARALGLSPDQVTADVCFCNPVSFRVNNDVYVRSIQKVNDDGSITFYCAVEEGMVVEITAHEDMRTELNNDFSRRDSEGIELFIACNCILRALEASKDGLHEDLGQIISAFSPHVIGFDTYGEQLNGLHINQTLVGVALRKVA